MLGPLRVVSDGEMLDLPTGRQRALLANLIIANGRSVPSDQLVDAVWGDAPPSNPANTLQHAVAQLRKLLEPDRVRGEDPKVLISESTGYRLEVDGPELDSELFVTATGEARNLLADDRADLAVVILEEGLALWRGSAYADFPDSEFARVEQERLAEHKVAARELLIDARLDVNGPQAVTSELEALVTEFPFREGLWARLMRALYQSGRQADALSVYRRAERILGDELGITPSVELRELEEQILLHDPSLTLDSAVARLHNLPAPTNRLIGREDELTNLLGALRQSRLVTLLGPGGSGKTRLALEAARESVRLHRDGVWLVRLDDLVDGSLLATVIGAQIGMPETPGSEVVDTLAGYIRSKDTMLVLDNCEHLTVVVSQLVERLLDACPNLVVCATSQEPLNLRSEQRFPVPPLTLPGETGTPFGNLDAVASVSLFVERANAIDPGIDLSATAMNAIANIVRELDGMPLAIELAAARVDMLTPSEIAVRLADPFAELVSGPRDAPARQQSLRNVVEWSVDLLTEQERDLLICLGVFAGSFDMAAVAAVAHVALGEADELLAGLVRRSLVNRVAPVAGTSRFRLLETIRRYGFQRLTESGLASEKRGRHANHFAARALELDTAIMGPGQLAAFAALVADEDNFRAAITWSIESAEHGNGVVIAARMGRFWDWRGSLADANTWTGRLVNVVTDETLPDFGFLMGWYAYIQMELGHDSGSKELLEKAVAIGERGGDGYAVAMALTGVALLARTDGDLERALEVGGRIRELATLSESPWGVAWSHNHDAMVLVGLDRLDAAATSAEASLAMFTALGDRRATGWALTALAQVALERGDHPTAQEFAQKAAATSSEVGDGRNAAWAYELAAASARATGYEDRAIELAEQASQLLTERGMPFSPWRR